MELNLSRFVDLNSVTKFLMFFKWLSSVLVRPIVLCLSCSYHIVKCLAKFS